MKYFVVLALAVMVWLFYQQHSTAPQVQKHVMSQEYMKQITMLSYSADGKPIRKLSAKKWSFDPVQGKSDISVPYLTVFKPNGDIWNLSANNAYAWHKTMGDHVTQVDMLGDVVIERAATANSTPTTLTTNSLCYFPDEEKVTSDVLVAMRQPGLTIEGYGLIGYINKNWVKILDRTTTVYQSHVIKARQAVFDNNTKTAVYTDNVSVNKDESELTSDTLSIYNDNTMLAEGKPANFNKNGDMISGPTLRYDANTETLYSQNTTVTLQPKRDK